MEPTIPTGNARGDLLRSHIAPPNPRRTLIHCLPHSERKPDSTAGFTLLELMIVITIILILATIGAGRYQQSVLRAREAALKQDLFVMRQAIDQYTIDKEQAPQSLDDLVSAGYLREVPLDPITRQKDWNVETSDIVLSPEQTTTGIVDVHSSATQTSPFEGTPYSSW